MKRTPWSSAPGTDHRTLDDLCLLARAIHDLAWLADGRDFDDDDGERLSSLLRAIDVVAVQLHDELDALQGQNVGFLDPIRRALAERTK